MSEFYFEIDEEEIADWVFEHRAFGEKVNEAIDIDTRDLASDVAGYISFPVDEDDFETLKSEIEELKEELQNTREAIMSLDDAGIKLSGRVRLLERPWKQKMRAWWTRVTS